MDELEQLQQQIAEMQKKAEALQQERKAHVVAEIKAKIKAYGLTVKDLGLGNAPKESNVAAKYTLNGQTWSGRGRQPRFISEYVESGGNLDDLLITK